MNMKHIPQQLEIIFWRLAVKLMKDRKRLAVVSIAFFMTTTLVAGSLAILSMDFIVRQSTAYGQSELETIKIQSPIRNKTGGQLGGQHRTLVVLTDELTCESPRIEGVWLVVYLPARNSFTMLPVALGNILDVTAGDGELTSAFHLETDGSLSDDFQHLLQEKELYWNNYLVIDRIAIAELVESSGGIDLGHGPIGGPQAITQLPLAWDHPQDALLGQVELSRGLCRKMDEFLGATDPVQLLERLDGHIYTDFNIADISPQWGPEKMLSGDGICEFPTVHEAGPIAVVPSGIQSRPR